MKKNLVVAIFILVFGLVCSTEKLRVFTWEGYVTQNDIDAVNKILKQNKYDIEVEVISPYAVGPEQMYDIMRADKCDISFLTLNYIKMQGEKTIKLLQPINTKSPRLSNYAKLRNELKNISMGMTKDGVYYTPFGGGAYGMWANMKKLKEAELPKSVKELWDEKWKGKISLSKGQVQPNIAMVMLAMGKPPYYLNDLLNQGKRAEASAFADKDGEAQKKTDLLYKQVKEFWDTAPDYSDDYLLVASYGIEIASENAKGGKWKLVDFKEGNTVWMDTVNFMKTLSGAKLEAAEIFANYFMGKEVQTRVVNGLSMVSVSTLVDSNPLIEDNPNFFAEKMFWPPYNNVADNVMKNMSQNAMNKIK